jgi:hypothetical protein
VDVEEGGVDDVVELPFRKQASKKKTNKLDVSFQKQQGLKNLRIGLLLCWALGTDHICMFVYYQIFDFDFYDKIYFA